MKVRYVTITAYGICLLVHLPNYVLIAMVIDQCKLVCDQRINSVDDAEVYYVMCLEMLLVVDQSTIQSDYLVGDIDIRFVDGVDGI